MEAFDKAHSNMPTYLRREDCHHTMGPGESEDRNPCNKKHWKNTVSLSLKEIMEFTGMNDLNDRNGQAMSDFPPTIFPDQISTYRLAGVAFNLRLNYRGSTTDKERPLHAILYIDRLDGYHNFGYKTVYETYPTEDGELYSYHNLYRRGIKVRFFSGGQVGKFDVIYFVVQLTSFFVLLSLSATVVSFLAFNVLGYRSKVYKAAAEHFVNIRMEHARAAAQTIIAATAFSWIKNETRLSPDMTKISLDEMTAALVMSSNMPPISARSLATEIIRAQTGGKTTFMPFNKFVNLLTPTDVDLSVMQDRLTIEHEASFKRWSEVEDGNLGASAGNGEDQGSVVLTSQRRGLEGATTMVLHDEV